MDSNYKKYYDIDTVAIIKGLLARWYFILALAVVSTSAAYFTGLFCRSLVSKDVELNPLLITEITTEDEAEQIRGMLSDDAMQEIDICLERVDRMQEQKAYMNEAILMQVDPYNCKRLTVEYEAVSEQKGVAKNIASQYSSFVSDDEKFYDAVNRAIDDPEGHYHISDVVTVEKVEEVSEGERYIARVDINIVIIDEWDEEAVTKAVRSAIDSYKPAGIAADTVVTFEFFRSSSVTKSFTDVQTSQSKVISQYNNDTSYLNSAVYSLDRPTALLFNYILRQEGLEQDYKAVIDEPLAEDLLAAEESKGIAEKIAEKSLKKLVILGFGGGVFAACGLILCYWLIRGKAGRRLGISVMSDRPLFGILKKNGGKEESSKAIETTADNLASFFHRAEIKRVDIVCIGKPGEKYEKTIRKLCNMLNSTDDIKAHSCCIGLDDPYGFGILDKLGENVVLCIAFEENSIREIYTLEHQLTAANIRVFGSVGIE